MAFFSDAVIYLESDICTEEQIRNLATRYSLEISMPLTKNELKKRLINGFIRKLVELSPPAAAVADDQNADAGVEALSRMTEHLQITTGVRRAFSRELLLQDPMDYIDRCKKNELMFLGKYFGVNLPSLNKPQLKKKLIHELIMKVDLQSPPAAEASSLE